MAAVVTGTERRVAAVVQTPQLLAQLSAIHDAAAPETSDGCTGDGRRANAGAAQGDSCAHRPRMYRYSCTRRWLPTSRTRGPCRRNRPQSIGRWAQQGTTRSCTAAARSRWPSDELASTRSRAVHAPSDRDRESVRGGEGYVCGKRLADRRAHRFQDRQAAGALQRPTDRMRQARAFTARTALSGTACAKSTAGVMVASSPCKSLADT